MSAWIPVEGIILQTECRCLNFMCTMDATHDMKVWGGKVWKTLFSLMRALQLEKLFIFGRGGSLLLCVGFLCWSEQVLPFLCSGF